MTVTWNVVSGRGGRAGVVAGGCWPCGCAAIVDDPIAAARRSRDEKSKRDHAARRSGVRRRLSTDVRNAHTASTMGSKAVTIISTKCQADRSVVTGMIRSKSATSTPLAGGQVPAKHGDGEQAEIGGGRRALDQRLIAREHAQAREERNEHERGRKLVAQDHAQQEEQEEQDQRRWSRINHVTGLLRPNNTKLASSTSRKKFIARIRCRSRSSPCTA